MNVKSQDSPKPWVDPDDAPELTQDFFEQGERENRGQTTVSREKIGDRPRFPAIRCPKAPQQLDLAGK